jgi:hypothetical protein
MEVHFNPDLQTRLSRMAEEQGRAAEALVEEAVERIGELIDHGEIRKLIPG